MCVDSTGSCVVCGTLRFPTTVLRQKSTILCHSGLASVTCGDDQARPGDNVVGVSNVDCRGGGFALLKAVQFMCIWRRAKCMCSVVALLARCFFISVSMHGGVQVHTALSHRLLSKSIKSQMMYPLESSIHLH